MFKTLKKIRVYLHDPDDLHPQNVKLAESHA